MYVIKMDENRTLVTTVHEPIYQGDSNSVTIQFILPKLYGNVSISDCSVLLRYILPNGFKKTNEISLSSNQYNEDYLSYSLTLDSSFTDIAGDIECWISIISLNDNLVLKTGSAFIDVTPQKDPERFLSNKDRELISDVTDRVSKLEREKADNLAYDSATKNLHLTSGGVTVGDMVEISSDSEYSGIIDFDEKLSRGNA